MDQLQPSFQAEPQTSVVASQNQSIASPVPRIERAEFEGLLERAMEILSPRAKTASHA
ncbi:MAG: hypothetical protein WA639_02640 [Candidatus Acidiferrum sp.]